MWKTWVPNLKIIDRKNLKIWYLETMLIDRHPHIRHLYQPCCKLRPTSRAKLKRFVLFPYRNIIICIHNDVIKWKHFPRYWPYVRSFNVSFNLALKKRLSEQSWGWWFETPSRSSWRHCYDEMCWVSGKLCWLQAPGHACAALGQPCAVWLQDHNGLLP